MHNDHRNNRFYITNSLPNGTILIIVNKYFQSANLKNDSFFKGLYTREP